MLNSFFARFECNDGDELRLPPHHTQAHNNNITINQSEVLKLFRKCNTRKSQGPDNICGNVLKYCAEQLAPVFTPIFQSSLDQHTVPLLWKTSTIVPIPKIPRPLEPKDYRPIALTSLVMKCFEKIMKTHILSQTQESLDVLQFAYQPNRGVDDAIITLLHLIYTHLETPQAHVKILFVDFSSAFNTIRPHILAQRLQEEFSLDSGLILWLLDFLSQRVQQVKVGMSLSETIVTSTGSPQGCVLSALLFILYTNCLTSSFPRRHLIKYADDTALVSLLLGDENEHGPILEEFISRCEVSNLLLNTSKTVEMPIDFRREPRPHSTTIRGQAIQTVTEYKYLGVVLDDKLKWDKWTDSIYKKGQQRIYFLKKLASFNVNHTMLKVFYNSFVESVLTFGLICWFGNASETQKNTLRKIVSIASKVLGMNLNSLSDIYKARSIEKAKKIISDPRHHLNSAFELLPLDWRLRLPFYEKNWCKFSFVPKSIKFLNEM